MPTAAESKVFQSLFPSIPYSLFFTPAGYILGNHHLVFSVYLCQLHHIMLLPCLVLKF